MRHKGLQGISDDGAVKQVITDRRGFIVKTLGGLGLAAVGTTLWSGHVGRSMAAPPVLRPPGALSEKEFLLKCAKCGICVNDCPYDALKLAAPGDGLPIGTPYYLPRERPCYMCTDVPCAAGCPTGALDLALLVPDRTGGSDRPGGPGKPDINLARMGLAAIDRETCIAYWGMQCDVCYTACPLIGKAINVDYTRNERTGKHAFLSPVVDSEHCTGCGLCEHVCITEEASIIVLPRGLAQGKSNARYLKGWSPEDERRLEDAPMDVITETPKSGRSPVDYLNQGFK